jgi:hypothetical protein
MRRPLGREGGSLIHNFNLTSLAQIFIGSLSRGANHHMSLFQRLPPPQLGGSGSCIYIHKYTVAQLHPQTLGNSYKFLWSTYSSPYRNACFNRVQFDVIFLSTENRLISSGIRPPTETRNKFFFFSHENYLKTFAVLYNGLPLCREYRSEIYTHNCY